MDHFIESLRTDYQTEGGNFTLHPEALRRKMLDSLPPGPSGFSRAVSHLRTGLRLSGLTVPPEGSIATLGLSQTTYILVPYNGPVPQNHRLATSEVVRKCAEQPFSSSDPLELELSRSMIWLAGLEATIIWEWRGPQIGLKLTQKPNGSVVESKLRTSSRLHLQVRVRPPRKIELFPTRQDVYNIEVSRGLGRETHFDLTPERALHTSPCLNLWKSYRQQALHGVMEKFPQGYFEYRCRHLVLMEQLWEESEPLAWPLLAERPRETLKRRIEQTFDPCHVPVLKRLPQDLAERDFLRLRAAIALRLTDAPAEVRLSDWGPLLRVDPERTLPPGLVISLVWPGLVMDIWGEEIVKNKALADALEWIETQVENFMSLFRSNFEEILSDVRSKISKLYHQDVERQMQRLWGGEH